MQIFFGTLFVAVAVLFLMVVAKKRAEFADPESYPIGQDLVECAIVALLACGVVVAFAPTVAQFIFGLFGKAIAVMEKVPTP